MAARSSTVELIFRGITRGLTGAAAQARRAASEAEAAERNLANARREAENAAGRLQTAEDSLLSARSQDAAALSRIGVAETNLERTRARSGDAVTRLGAAEAELDRVRQSGSTEEIERAEARVTRVRQESDTAAAALQRAESALASARANGDSSAARVLAAEENLARTRRENEAALGRLGDAEERHRRAQDGLDNSTRNSRGGLRDLAAGILGVIRPFTELAGLVGNVDTKMGAFGAALAGIGGPIAQLVTGVIELVLILGSLGEVVGVVGGLIGQALAGAPALLFAIGVAAGTVMLGMDGIKKAAESLKAPFEQLKASVSGVFEKQLTPAFRELARVIPSLTPSLNGVALAISGVIKNLVDLVARGTDGLANLKTAIGGTEAFVRGLTLGLTTFVTGFLNAVAAAAPAMNSLGEAIGNVFGRIGDVFNKLANNGVIQAAVQGLAATLKGLGDVIAPVIELFIRMGAALGQNLGPALTNLGSLISGTIPFFEHLALVAGDILRSAFEQLTPPILRLMNDALGPAGSTMDGFASMIKGTVLPAIANFIDWLRTTGIPGIKAFVLGATVSFLEFVSAALSMASTVLGIMHDLFSTLALIPSPFQRQFAEAAAATGAFKDKLDGVKSTVDGLKDKTVKVQLQTQGAELVRGMQDSINKVTDKTVKVISNVFGKPENEKLKEAIDNVPSKAVNTTSTVAGEQANRTLKSAIDAVYTKTTQTLSNVFGEPQNKSLKSAIDAVQPKTVDVRANVAGESAVRSLISAIAAVHDKTVTIVSNVINNVARAFADGGRVPTSGQFLVGERGPELLTLDAFGGVITPAARTRQMLNAQRNRRPGATTVGAEPAAAAESPVTVNVMLSQEYFTELARVEIARQNRATKRTVLAGSGVTF